MKLGFFYTVFKEKKATEYSIQSLKIYYPDSPIYLVSDGGLNFSYLEEQYQNIKTSFEDDTMSDTFNITAGTSGCDYVNGNYRDEFYQNVIKKCAYTVLDRISRAIEYCNYPDWMVMCDPDCLIRGKLSFPPSAKLLGSKINCCLPEGYRNILKSIDGAVAISRWGSSPCVFEVSTFLRALEKFRYLDTVENLLDKLCLEFYAMYAHDVLFPTLFALVGEEEHFNDNLVECTRDPNWKTSLHPLVHQFREYY